MNTRTSAIALAATSVTIVLAGCASLLPPTAAGVGAVGSDPPPAIEELPPATPNPDPAIADACALAKAPLVRIANTSAAWAEAGDYSPPAFDLHVADLFMQIQYTHDTATHPEVQQAVARLGEELAAAVWVHQETTKTDDVSDAQRLAITEHAIETGFEDVFVLCMPEG